MALYLIFNINATDIALWEPSGEEGIFCHILTVLVGSMWFGGTIILKCLQCSLVSKLDYL